MATVQTTASVLDINKITGLQSTAAAIDAKVLEVAYVHPSTDGSLHVPATGTTNNGKVLTAGATAGSLTWETVAAGGSGVTDHTLLTNIGTNTHAQIDTALGRLVNTSGTNTGDEDVSSIKTKLGITTLSGSNTGDQDLSGYSATTHNHTGTYEPVITKNTGFNLNTGTTTGTLATGDHTHTGVYEPADATILKDADIGTAVQAYSANTTLQGNTFNGISQLVQTDGTGKLPAIDGSLLTNLPSSADATKLPLAGGDMTGTIRYVYQAMVANDIAVSTADIFSKTISGATTLTVSSVPASPKVAVFNLELTNGGSAVITWFSGVKWAGGTAPTLTAAGLDILQFYSRDGGTTWRGAVISKDNK